MSEMDILTSTPIDEDLMNKNYEFKLYVCENSVSSQIAEAKLEAMLEDRLKGQYTLELIDILKERDRTKADGILVSPTLVKVNPPPKRRIVGDLSNPNKVMSILFQHREGQ